MEATQFQTEISQWSEQLMVWAKSAESFAQAQAPMVVNEILAKEIIFASIFIAVALIFLAFSFDSYRQMQKLLNQRQESGAEDRMILFVVSGGVGGVMFFVNLHNLLMAIFAPRIVIIEYLANLAAR